MNTRFVPVATLALGLTLALSAGAKCGADDSPMAEFQTQVATHPDLARRVSKFGMQVAYKEWRRGAAGRRSTTEDTARASAEQSRREWSEFVGLTKRQSDLARRATKVGMVVAYQEWHAQRNR